MTEAAHGDTVNIHYTGKFTDGTVFDSSSGREPLAFELGSGQVIPGLDKAMRGMTVGAKKTIDIPADEAYGPHHPEGVQQVQRDQLPQEIETKVGTQLQATGADGQTINLTIVEESDDVITMDANHPLAGKDLVFDVELVSIG